MSHVVITTFVKNGRRYRKNQPFAHPDINTIRDLEKKNLIQAEKTFEDIKKKYKEAVCIASGTSLTKEDVEKVRVWQQKKPDDRLVIVTNETYRIAPFANILYACDAKYWNIHLSRIKQHFKGDLATHCHHGALTRARSKDFRNSGANAISLAAFLGCEKIYLLAFDCSIKNGFHWHGEHAKGLSNCKSIASWKGIFENVATEFKDKKIINMSRQTELVCFKKGELEKCLKI
jgi:hypothetical protein